jgi:poly-beta-hydroxybutyrate-responsive repressor
MQGMGRGRGRGRGRRRRRHIRGFLEPCLLLILRQGPNHGYELKDGLGPFGLGEVNPSLIYRALRDMEDEGLTSSEWDTESTAGPARRVYAITDAGLAHLERWATELRETDRVLHHFIEVFEQTSEPS